MKVRRAAALAAVSGLVAGPLMSIVGVGAGPVAVSTVAVLADDGYVDAVTETPNLIDDLEAGGHTVIEIEDISNESWVAATEAADVIAVPELEGEGDLAGDLSDEAIATITAWVDGGGRFLVFGSGSWPANWEDIFGWDIVEFSDENCGFDDEGNDASVAAEGDPCPLGAEGGNTEWADGPAELGYVSHTTGLVLTSLPEGSTVVYQGVSDDEFSAVSTAGIAINEDVAALVSMPYGDGVVVYHGWDWYPEVDGEITAASVQEEAAWATVLDFSVSQPEVSASSPAPGALQLTQDSPSTQPVFVRLVINGTEHTVVIAAKTTEANFDVGGAATVEWDVPGWGIGEGTVEVLGATAAPPAEPTPAAPDFTG